MDNEEKEQVEQHVINFNEEKKGNSFSKEGLLGVVNGLLGLNIYQVILSFFASLIITFVVSFANNGGSLNELQEAYEEIYTKLPMAALVYLLSGLVTLGVFIYLIKWDKVKQILKKFNEMKALKYGALCALSIMTFSVVYNNLAINLFNLSAAGNENQESVVELVNSNYFLGFLSVVLIAPVIEEFTFRYCLFGEIKKKNRWLAYLVTGLVFMIMHSLSSFVVAGGFNKAFWIETLYLPPYLFSGLALCYVYEKTDNLNTPIYAHIINNLISFLVVVLL